MQGDFQPGGVGRVVQQAVAKAEGVAVERAGRRHADIPAAGAARKVLNGGLGAAGQYVDARRLEAEAVEVAGGDFTSQQRRVAGQRAQVVEVGFAAVQAGGVQRVLQFGQRSGAVLRVDNHLGQHRVEVGRHFQPGFDPVVDADAVTGREGHFAQQACAGLEVAERVFGVQTQLNGMALGCKAGAASVELQLFAGGQTYHPLDQINAEHLLGDAMLNLQAGVHFQEVELVAVGVVDKFDGAGVAVVDAGQQLFSGGVQLAAYRVAQVRCRAFFHDFLVAALAGAVAFTECQRVALAVGKHLHLNVAGAGDEFLQEHAVVGKVAGAKALDAVEGADQFVFAVAQLHADTAATGGALEHDRIADTRGFCLGCRQIGQQIGARQQRHIGLLGQLAGAVLETEGEHLLGRRADKGDPGGLAAAHEVGVLTEEAVTGVDGLGAGVGGNGQQFVDLQIGVGSGAFAEAVGLVGQPHVQAVGVAFGVNGNGADAELAQGADDTGGDGATVGDQNLVEHVASLCRAVPGS